MAMRCVRGGRECDGCSSCQSGPKHERAAEILDELERLQREYDALFGEDNYFRPETVWEAYG